LRRYRLTVLPNGSTVLVMHSTPTVSLSLLARDLLLMAQEQIEAHPSKTLYLACFHAAHGPVLSPALEEIYAALDAEVLESSGADACELITSLLATAGYPDLQGAPTVPAPPPIEAIEEEPLLNSIAALAHVGELLQRARGLLRGHHEQGLISAESEIEAVTRALLVELDRRTAALGEAAE
jgi:hypothetical protein